MMNTAIEVMQEIAKYKKPIKAWVSDNSHVWEERIVTGANKEHQSDSLLDTFFSYGKVFNYCSLTDPNKKICKCVKCKREFEMPLNFLGIILCEACDPHMSRPRPMTAREFARFVGENMGKYLYQNEAWPDDDWSAVAYVSDATKVSHWLYAENVPGELVWRELPEVEE